jgi:cytochrome c-type biogenesis protein CcmI
MPDLGQWLLLALVVGGSGIAIGWPLWRGSSSAAPPPDTEGPALRHRVALEALHDVEADHRAGSLDEAAYRRQREEAEAHAAQTLADLDAARSAPRPPETTGPGRRAVAWLGGALVVALLVAFALPAPIGLGERTQVNQPLADAQATEAARQASIQRLLTQLSADQKNTTVLSDLADAYLAGSSTDDLQRAAVALQVLISLDPQNRSAYRRLVTAYLAAGDWADGKAATDSYAALAPNEPDIPFFRGLIALRGSNDTAEAIRQFDLFLGLAPNDARAAMIRSLRAEAAGQLSGASPTPGG